MIKLKCYCGSEVEASFAYSYTSNDSVYEKEIGYARDWLKTHKCRKPDEIISEPLTDNKIMLPVYPPKFSQGKVFSVRANDGYTVTNNFITYTKDQDTK